MTTTFKVEVDWDRDGNYTDETNNFISATGGNTLVAPKDSFTGGNGTVDQCTIRLWNGSFRYSTKNTSSPLYSIIANGGYFQARVRFSVTIDGLLTQLFFGVLRNIVESPPTSTQSSQITLDCRSYDDVIMQAKFSTTRADFVANNKYPKTEDKHIIDLLTESGLVDGVHFVSAAYAASHPGTQVTIDTGCFLISYAWVDDESPLEDIWNMVGGCLGWFFTDRLGKFHYVNITGMTPSANGVHNVGAPLVLNDGNTKKIQFTWDDSDLYNEVVLEVAPREIGPTGEVWKNAQPITIAGNSSETINAKFSRPMVQYNGIQWDARDAAGRNMAASIAFTSTFYAQRAQLVFTNSSTKTVYVTGINIQGSMLEGGREYEIVKRSTLGFWETVAGNSTKRGARTKSIRGNVYVQHRSHAEWAAQYLLKRFELPNIVLDVDGVNNPAAVVGRGITLQYPGMISTPISAIIMKTNWTAGVQGFTLDLEAADLTSSFTCTPYFVVGTNKNGAAGGSLVARLF